MVYDMQSVLKQYFGYPAFRKGQEELIDSLLSGRDAVGIMPTGAGKSLCYQVPALLFDGITLVISPLISLMKDQVSALTQAGIPAAYINSSLTPGQAYKAFGRARAGAYKIIYVAPERLLTDGFLDFAQNTTVSLIAVDEAHCISQWGQDFRPSYLKIRQFIDSLPKRPVIGAFTATATSAVRQDIVKILELENPTVVTTGFDRENLYFEVQHPSNKKAALLHIVDTNKEKCGIVYCSTRKAVDEVCGSLCAAGYSATEYHAGLPDEERRRNQDDFLYDRRRIMVATNAFGMGIDKSDVSYVVHYNMPKDLESYYQEAGRAGRDGEPAQCILLYGGQDVRTNEFLIENSSGNEELDEHTAELIKEKDRERLKQMTFYCHTNDCLREYILRYFGETPPNFCGNCSNCNRNFEDVDITVDAQKILSCVKRAGERYGIKMICDILRGSQGEKLITSGLDRLPTYGIMADTSEKRLRDILHYLVLQKYLSLTDDKYPVLQLTVPSRKVLVDRIPLHMKAAKTEEKQKKTSGKKIDLPENAALFERLKNVRTEIAKKQSVPAFVVFSDAALHDMCAKQPKTDDEFLEVSGVGLAKLKKYGQAFLPVIREFCDKK